MGLWNDGLLPRLIDRGMRNDFMAQHRERAAPLATGRVLEIGSGSGLNFPEYTDQVTHLFALEPSQVLSPRSRGDPGEHLFRNACRVCLAKVPRC